MYPISLSCRFSFWPWAFQEQWGSSHRAAQFLAFEWCRAGAERHPKSFATCIIELQSLGSFAKWIDSSWEPGHQEKCFGSKKWCWCWRAEVILWQYLYGSVLFHFFHARSKVEPIYWVEAVHVHHSGSENEEACRQSVFLKLSHEDDPMRLIYEMELLGSNLSIL